MTAAMIRCSNVGNGSVHKHGKEIYNKPQQCNIFFNYTAPQYVVCSASRQEAPQHIMCSTIRQEAPSTYCVLLQPTGNPSVYEMCSTSRQEVPHASTYMCSKNRQENCSNNHLVHLQFLISPEYVSQNHSLIYMVIINENTYINIYFYYANKLAIIIVLETYILNSTVYTYLFFI